MKTDTLFYQLFRTFHTLLFELMERSPIEAEGYQFVSAEVKEKAFRFDGIFLPERTDKPLIFTEVQFQPKEDFYREFFAEIFLYLNQYRPEQDWQAAAIFARRNLDPGISHHYRELLTSDRVIRVYLEDWATRDTTSFGIAIVQLILASESKAPELARQLAVQVERGAVPQLRDEVVEFIGTVLLYKFPQLSRQEIEAMFTLSDLRHTRVYQEAALEGEQKGRLEGEQKGRLEGKQEGLHKGKVALLLRQLTRKLGKIPAKVKLKIEKLSISKLEKLGLAIFDLNTIADLENWLQSRK